jgi:predicted transcriptional regulator
MRRSRDDEIIHDLLARIDDGDALNQRTLARELNIALGMANAYVRRCVRKGYVKIRQVPPNRYAYYLTPTGFAEKSRLTAEFLSDSFRFIRRARSQYAGLYEICVNQNWRRLALAGVSELADTALLSARDYQVSLIGMIEPKRVGGSFLGLPVVAQPAALGELDAVLLTGLDSPHETQAWLAGLIPPERILAPALLGLDKAGNGAPRAAPGDGE